MNKDVLFLIYLEIDTNTDKQNSQVESDKGTWTKFAKKNYV